MSIFRFSAVLMVYGLLLVSVSCDGPASKGAMESGEDELFISELPDSLWDDAKWIGLEEMHDSLKVIPGIHGSGDHLGDKLTHRPVVPLFRKEFEVDRRVDRAILYVSGLGQIMLLGYALGLVFFMLTGNDIGSW